MKIAILCHTSAGGSGVLATELALGLCQFGHEVHVIGDRAPFRMGEVQNDSLYTDLGPEPPKQSFWGKIFAVAKKSFEGRFSNKKGQESTGNLLHFHELLSFEYPLFDKASFPTLRAANTLASLIEKFQIEVVNAHYVIPHATSAILARDCGLDCKIVTTLHGTDITKVGLDPAFFFTTKHAIESSDGVTAVCSFLAAEASRNFQTPKPILVIPNWVDSNRFIKIEDPAARLRYAHPEELLCIHVSNFRDVKRSRDVITIFSKILRSIQARLLLVGEGPEKKGCLDLAIELGVSGRIVSMAPIPEIERLLGISDVLFLPSEIEAFPLVLLEGMSAGVVCISTDVGGIPELIVHGETGFMFSVGATDEMADAACRIASDQGLKEKITSNARELVRKRYSPEFLIGHYLNLYESILKIPAHNT